MFSFSESLGVDGEASQLGVEYPAVLSKSEQETAAWHLPMIVGSCSAHLAAGIKRAENPLLYVRPEVLKSLFHTAVVLLCWSLAGPGQDACSNCRAWEGMC